MGSMCKAPEAPDTSRLAASQERLGNRALDLQEEQLDYYYDVNDRTTQMIGEVLEQQQRHAEEQALWARQDRERYINEFQPQEDSLLKEANEYASPEKQALEAARAQAAIQQSFDASQRNAEQRMAALGMDISQVSAAAMDRDARNQMAAQQAMAGNQAREHTKAVGRALRSEAINIGKGYPGQSLAAYGMSGNNYNSMVANNATAANTGMGHIQAAQGWGNQALSGYNSAVNTMNSGYANQLNAYNSANPMATIATLAGAAGGAAMSFNEGGMVGTDGQPQVALPTDYAPGEDTVDAKLTKGEYVVPVDVVQWKGQEFFEKLAAKSRQDRQMSQQDSGAAGPGGIPQPPKQAGAGQ